MKRYLQLLTAAAAIGVLTLTAIRGLTPASAQTEGFSDQQVKSIQKVIKDYLIANPEVLLEVNEAYEKKVEAKKAEAQATSMPQMYKAIAGMKDDLSAFTVGNGDVTMVEFFDYNCPYCVKAVSEVVKLQTNEKNLKILFMEYPILSAGSLEASKIAVAAAKQGKYFDFHREMFASGKASKDSALKVAEKIGLNMDKAKADAASPETEAFIAKVGEIGRRASIDGTPSFIAGDHIYPGAADYDQLRQLIDQVRKEGCKACATADNSSDTKTEKKS